VTVLCFFCVSGIWHDDCYNFSVDSEGKGLENALSSIPQVLCYPKEWQGTKVIGQRQLVNYYAMTDGY
jgi:hypothetical protein